MEISADDGEGIITLHIRRDVKAIPYSKFMYYTRQRVLNTLALHICTAHELLIRDGAVYVWTNILYDQA